jgi:hypothetical protein
VGHTVRDGAEGSRAAAAAAAVVVVGGVRMDTSKVAAPCAMRICTYFFLQSAAAVEYGSYICKSRATATSNEMGDGEMNFIMAAHLSNKRRLTD